MEERNPKINTVEELVADDRFQNYCLKVNVEDDNFWEDIVFTNWNQKSTFEQADQFSLNIFITDQFYLTSILTK